MWGVIRHKSIRLALPAFRQFSSAAKLVADNHYRPDLKKAALARCLGLLVMCFSRDLSLADTQFYSNSDIPFLLHLSCL